MLNRVKVLPVIERELLAATRRPWTARVRTLFALAGILTCLVILTLHHVRSSDQGQMMLVALSILTLTFSLLSGCFLTADCISQEKREGTLGLLFLTPLRSWDIVLGKLASHSLQVSYGLLAIFPVFFLPILNGGVTWAEVVRILLVLVSALLLSLCLGLLFSVLSTESKTPVLATFVTILAVALLPVLYVTLQADLLRRGVQLFGFPQLSPAILLMTAFDRGYRTYGPQIYWLGVALHFFVCLGLLTLCVQLLPRVWQRSKQTRATQPKKRTCLTTTPALVSPNANPYAWRSRRGATDPIWLRWARGTLLCIITIMLVLSTRGPRAEEPYIIAFLTAYALHLLVKFSAALEATRPLQQDRHTGALELVLVTPLGAQCVLPGVHQAFLETTRRPFRLLTAVNLALLGTAFVFRGPLHMDQEALLGFSIIFLGGVAAATVDRRVLAWIGFRQALTASTHLKAALITFALAMVPSWLLFVGVVIALSKASGNLGALVAFGAWHTASLALSLMVLIPTRQLLLQRFREFAALGNP